MKRPIRCVIIDDEVHAQKLLKKYILDTGLFEILKEYSSSSEAIEELDSLMPEVIFLDIQMPGKTGFDVLNELQASSNYSIVFTTAYDQYAIEAFNVSAVDYLLKPFDRQRFNESVIKIIKAVEYKSAEIKQKLADNANFTFNESISTKEKKIDRLTCKYGNKLKIVQVTDIVYFEASGNYTKAHTTDNFYLLNTSISDLVEKLDRSHFVRVHRSYIININFILTVEPHFNGEYILGLKNEIIVKVSRSYKDAFNDAMGIF